MTLRGASSRLVADAERRGDPLPGTAGFAGEHGGGIVRDVLGRIPVFTERGDPCTWRFDPGELADPEPVPAGHRRTPHGDERLWTLPDPPPEPDRDAAVDDVRHAIATTLDGVSAEGLAVAFSGGVDSALVASALDAPLYVVGFEGSHDIEAARSAADLMGRELTVVEVSLREIEDAVPAVARAIGRTNAMDVSIALPLYFAGRAAAGDGHGRLAVGQGADELFGGYAKVANAPGDHRVEADTVRGARREVVDTLPDQLERDVLAVRVAEVEPVAPLLHDRVVRAALRLPGDLLVTADGERKWALRRAARGRVPDEVAFRDKKAVQYGSLISRELDRLARRAGYKRRMDDHVGRYVRSRLDAADP